MQKMNLAKVKKLACEIPVFMGGQSLETVKESIEASGSMEEARVSLKGHLDTLFISVKGDVRFIALLESLGLHEYTAPIPGLWRQN